MNRTLPERSPLALVAFACALAVAAVACRSTKKEPTGSSAAEKGLRPAAAFASITDPDERAAALFNEASRVLLHPRCSNCHPADERPRQGDESIAHVPPVWGGADGRGEPALRCQGCHQQANYVELKMPGAPDWHLAPKEMVFLGRDAASICEGLKDNQRNGGKTIAEVVDHVGHDALVAWGFAPGPGRSPPPGSQKTLHGLFAAWADAGAGCPPRDAGGNR